MTPFAALCGLAGLSQREAADVLTVRIDTIKSWTSGRRDAPSGAIAHLRELIMMQERAADEFFEELDAQTKQRGAPHDIELGYPTDDHEAQSLGWPCVGAWRAMAARVVAGTDIELRFVPAGTTLATAAATDEHETGREREKAPHPPKRARG